MRCHVAACPNVRRCTAVRQASLPTGRHAARTRSRAFAASASQSNPAAETIKYGGYCTICGDFHWLPCTSAAAAEAQQLVDTIHKHGRLDYASSDSDPRFSLDWLYTKGPGRMLGVLLAVDENEQQHVLKAFSGQITESWTIPGWVGPVAGIINTSPQYVTARTAIEQLSQQLQELDNLSTSCQTAASYPGALQHQEQQAALAHSNKSNSQPEPQQIAVASSDHQQPEPQQIAVASSDHQQSPSLDAQFFQEQRRLLKRQRKALSHNLLEKIQHSYLTQSVSGQSVSLIDVYLQYGQQQGIKLPVTKAGGFIGFPAGIGDCCAPKLLHAATAAGLKPVSLAEVWCGSAPGTGTKARLGRPVVLDDQGSSRRHMEYYGMCGKCSVILGTMLCCKKSCNQEKWLYASWQARGIRIMA